MNTQLNGLFSQDNSQKENASKNQKENVFFNGKAFTATDLWNIQRQGKSRIQRRFL